MNHSESTTTPADEFRATARALQASTITVDEARARNAALRARIGDGAYDVAKRAALVAIARGR